MPHQHTYCKIHDNATRDESGRRTSGQPNPVQTGSYWPKNSLDKWPGTIRMVIGPVIQPAGKSVEEITNEAEQWIETTVAGLGGRKPD